MVESLGNKAFLDRLVQLVLLELQDLLALKEVLVVRVDQAQLEVLGLLVHLAQLAPRDLLDRLEQLV